MRYVFDSFLRTVFWGYRQFYLLFRDLAWRNGPVPPARKVAPRFQRHIPLARRAAPGFGLVYGLPTETPP